MSRSLLECLYHQLRADVDDGFAFLKSSFFEMERRKRTDICRVIVSFTRDYCLGLPSDVVDASTFLWLDYFDTRIAASGRHHVAGEVERSYAHLLEAKTLPVDLRAWIIDELATLCQEQMQAARAKELRQALVDEPDPSSIYNVPLWHANLGNLHWMLAEYEEAIAQHRLAVEKSETSPGARRDIATSSRLALASLYGERGDWSSAFEEGVEAFYRARTTEFRDTGSQINVAAKFADLLLSFDLRASEAAASEALALAAPSNEERSLTMLGRLDSLMDAHLIRRARRLFDEFLGDPELARMQSPEDLDYRSARLLLREGREREAQRVFSTIIEAKAVRSTKPWLWSAAVYARGLNNTMLGLLSEAAADSRMARQTWSQSGCAVLAARATINQAQIAGRSGDRQQALGLLEEANGDVPVSGNPVRASLCTARGDIALAVGDWDEAEAQFAMALDLAAGANDHGLETTSLRKLAQVHTERARWSDAAECLLRAHQVSAILAAADMSEPEIVEQASVQSNNEGTQTLCAITDRARALDMARQFFVTASESDPRNLWPALNLSLTLEEMHDWQGATEAFTRVFELAPPVMLTSRLGQSLQDCAINQARQLSRQGHHAEAATVLSNADDHLIGVDVELARIRSANAVLLILAGQPAAVGEALGAALDAGTTSEALVDTVASFAEVAADIWTIETTLEQVEREAGLRPDLRELVTAARRGLGPAFGELLGLGTESEEPPYVTPIIFEIGDDLIPIVDSNQDGGTFLFELIPEMRERIREHIGVTVPGIRARGNPALPLDGFSIEVNEVPVHGGSVPDSDSFVVMPFEGAATDDEVSDFHPLNGVSMLCCLRAPQEVDSAGEGEVLTRAAYLIHHIERALRSHLSPLVGPQEMVALMDQWTSEDEEGLLEPIRVDHDNSLRLTWVIDDLLDESVPVADWPALVGGVQDAGGLSGPIPVLRRTVRKALRHHLPGPQTGRPLIPVPAEHQAALLEAAVSGNGEPQAMARHAFLSWFRQEMLANGQALTLLLDSNEAREIASRIVRFESRLTTTLSQAELAP